MHCDAGVQAVLAMSEPTCRALCYSGADCLSDVGTYLPGTVLQWGRLFKRCRNLPAVHWWCRLFKQCWSLPAGHCFYSGESCFSNVGVYLPGTVLQGCRLFKQCQNLPVVHCVTVVKAV